MSEEMSGTKESTEAAALRAAIIAGISGTRVRREAVDELHAEIAATDADVADKTLQLIRLSKPFKHIAFRAENSDDVEYGEELPRSYVSVHAASDGTRAAVCAALGRTYTNKGWYGFDLPSRTSKHAAHIGFGIGSPYFQVSLEVGSVATARLLLDEYGIDLGMSDELRLLEDKRSDLSVALRAVEDRIAALKETPDV